MGAEARRAPAGAGWRRETPARGALLLALLTLAAYASALTGPFQFDDYNVIVHNPAVHSLAAWWESMPGIRPLLKLSYAANWAAGTGAAGFHAVNMLLHFLNALLVVGIVGRLLPRAGVSQMSAPGIALACAAIFLLHPAQTEAVTYISGRSVSLMAFFELAALRVWLHADESPRPLPWHGVAVLLFVLALASKENAWSLPFVLLLCEALRPGWRWRDALRRTAAFWAVLAAAVVAVFFVPGYWRLLAGSLEARTLGENLLTQAGGVFYLITGPLLALTPNLDPDLAVHAMWTPVLAAKAAMLFGAAGAALWQWRRRPWLGLAILWFFVMLMPTNSVLPRLDVANDRQLYLALIGPALLVAVATRRVLAARSAAIVLTVLCAVLGAATLVRNADYATEVALWEDTAAKSPRKARVFNNLGYVYQQAGRVGEARAAYLRVLELDPGQYKARFNLDSLPAPRE